MDHFKIIIAKPFFVITEKWSVFSKSETISVSQTIDVQKTMCRNAHLSSVYQLLRILELL